MNPAIATAKTSRLTPEQIWQDIVRLTGEMRLSPGGQLPSVRTLADKLAAKPTLIRDALLYAQAHGAVRVVPRVGAFLETTSSAARALTGDLIEAVPRAIHAAARAGDENVLHLLDARRVIEVELVGRAAERRRIEDLLPVRRALEAIFQLPTDAPRSQYVERDIRFHVAIGRLAGNDLLARMQETLMELLRPYLAEVPSSLERRSVADRSHAAVYTALVEGNSQRARCEMLDHLNLAYDALLGELRQLPGGIAPEGPGNA